MITPLNPSVEPAGTRIYPVEAISGGAAMLVRDAVRCWRQFGGASWFGDDGNPRALFDGSSAFAIVGTERDSPFLYANRAILRLFDFTWAELRRTAARACTELGLQSERDRMLGRVSKRGIERNYSCIRVSRTGCRLLIGPATFWRVQTQGGTPYGIACLFDRFTPLEPGQTESGEIDSWFRRLPRRAFSSGA